MFKKLFRNQAEQTDMVSPVNGELIPIEDVNDPTFAKKIMGDGIAIRPLSDTIVAPCKSKVIMIYETKHAVGLETPDGMQIIIHIGIDTVEREGDGFEVVCEEGDVNLGDPLVVFDRVLLEKEAVDTTVLMIFVKNDSFRLMNVKKEGKAIQGESVVTQLVKEKV